MSCFQFGGQCRETELQVKCFQIDKLPVSFQVPRPLTQQLWDTHPSLHVQLTSGSMASRVLALFSCDGCVDSHCGTSSPSFCFSAKAIRCHSLGHSRTSKQAYGGRHIDNKQQASKQTNKQNNQYMLTTLFSHFNQMALVLYQGPAVKRVIRLILDQKKECFCSNLNGLDLI